MINKYYKKVKVDSEEKTQQIKFLLILLFLSLLSKNSFEASTFIMLVFALLGLLSLLDFDVNFFLVANAFFCPLLSCLLIFLLKMLISSACSLSLTIGALFSVSSTSTDCLTTFLLIVLIPLFSVKVSARFVSSGKEISNLLMKLLVNYY